LVHIIVTPHRLHLPHLHPQNPVNLLHFPAFGLSIFQLHARRIFLGLGGIFSFFH
jgi:hypothetical protein